MFPVEQSLNIRFSLFFFKVITLWVFPLFGYVILTYLALPPNYHLVIIMMSIPILTMPSDYDEREVNML